MHNLHKDYRHLRLPDHVANGYDIDPNHLYTAVYDAVINDAILHCNDSVMDSIGKQLYNQAQIMTSYLLRTLPSPMAEAHMRVMDKDPGLWQFAYWPGFPRDPGQHRSGEVDAMWGRAQRCSMHYLNIPALRSKHYCFTALSHICQGRHPLDSPLIRFGQLQEYDETRLTLEMWYAGGIPWIVYLSKKFLFGKRAGDKETK